MCSLFVGLCMAASGQTTTISPIPHSITWGGKAFSNTATYTLVGENTADSNAVAVLKKNFTTTGGSVQLIVGEKGDAAVSDYSSLIPTNEEGYYLAVTSDKVVIAGTDEAGTFHGVQSFLQIANQKDVMSVTISDYPQMPNRGVIEGFYGNPYSQTDRLRLFDFMGANKMNIYVYGPKDDPYHKSQWRVEYPAAQAAKMKELVKRAHDNHVTFVWAVHPGGDIKWTLADSMNVVKKFEAMYKLGVRSFCVFFDDIGGEGAKPEKQAGLLNYVTDAFVRKHSDVTPLMMCPTQYNRSWSSGTYLSILGTKMYPEVRIMWTGNSVVDMVNKSDMDWINSQIKRKAFIWLNYPVNDYQGDHILMGPTYGNDTQYVDQQVSGFCSNPMEYCEASKVSLYSIADYTWNLANYDSDASWERAINYLMPQHPTAFHSFCENNVDLGPTGHGLRRANESPKFTAAQATFETEMAKGYSATAVAGVRNVFTDMVANATELLADTSRPELTTELTPWEVVMKYMGQKGERLMDMYKALEEQKPEQFVSLYLQYDSINTLQKAVRSRNFPGSISKSPNPNVGSNFIVPFFADKLNKLIAEYKAKYNYRLDVFPHYQLEGKYFIKFNGKYLTDPNETQNGIAAQFVAARDNIKPQRQEWTITMDATSGRFKITNNQIGRYLNENGKFAANPDGANKYDPNWNTYEIQRWAGGKYSIKNGGSAGNKYWKVSTDGTTIEQSDVNTFAPENFIFEIIPTDSSSTEPIIEVGKSYLIRNNNLYLTNTNVRGTGGTPTFKALTGTPAMSNRWNFTIDPSTKRYKIVSAADDRYLKENGSFGTGSYLASWNTYNILEMNGAFAIQNAGSAGTKYWKIANNTLATGDAALVDSYVFEITLTTQTGIAHTTMSGKISCDVDGGVLSIASGDASVKSIRVCTPEGRMVAKSSNSNNVSLHNVPQGICLVTVSTSDGLYNTKIKVD